LGVRGILGGKGSKVPMMYYTIQSIVIQKFTTIK
jgi:hypothetical protein